MARKKSWSVLAEVMNLGPVMGITAGYALAAFFAAHVLDWPIHPPIGPTSMYVAVTVGLLVALVSIVAIPVVMLFLLVRTVTRLAGRSLPLDGRMILARLFAPSRLLGAVFLLSVYAIFIATFIAFKQAIPSVVPFHWDVAFMQLDRLIHGGLDPWRLIHPFLGRPPITKALDRLYYLWFPINFSFLIGFMWVQDRKLKVRFYTNFWLVWVVLGTVMAYGFSSAGPCYFSAVTDHSSPYVSLMDYLHQVDRSHGLVAVLVQAELWSDYTAEGANVVIKGISAMPSIHVALPALYTIAGWRIHPALGIALGLYTVLIVLGSVHLAWHYAVDGYVSVIAVGVLWLMTGLMTSRHRRATYRLETDPDRGPAAR